MKKVVFSSVIVLLLIELALDYLDIDTIWQIVFQLNFFLISTSLIYLNRNRILSYIRVDVIQEYLPITRVVYSIICLISAIQNLTLVKSGLEPLNMRMMGFEQHYLVDYLLIGIYMFFVINLLIGRWIRVSWIMIFLLAGFLVTFSLEIFFKNTINFFAIFISPNLWRGEQDAKFKDQGWPILLMLLSFAFLITNAGYFKLVDPIWNSGYGLFYSLNISYLIPKHLWFLLDYKPLLVVMNWITICVESLALPLVLFRKTRLLGILCVFMLGLFLTYPMSGIGLIGGPLLLSTGPMLLSITNISIPGLSRVSNLISKITFPSRSNTAFWNNSLFDNSFLKLIIWTFTVAGILFNVLQRRDNYLNFPPKYGSYKVKHTIEIDIPYQIDRRLENIEAQFGMIHPWTFHKLIWSIELFDYHHLFERFIFKVKFKMKNGEEKEPVKYFDEAGSLHDDYPLFYNERFVLSAWRIMSFYQNGNNDPSSLDKGELSAVIRYSEQQLEKDNLVEAVIYAKMLRQPNPFEKDKKKWINGNWFPVLGFDYETHRFKYFEKIKLKPFTDYKIKEFRNRDIVPAWDH